MDSLESSTNKSLTFQELCNICENKEAVLEFLKTKNLIKNHKDCPKCGWKMRLYKKNFWKCLKTVTTEKGKKFCNYQVSIRKGTWFDNTKLSYGQVLKLTYMLIYNYEQPTIVQELKISKVTVSQWNTFLKQVIMEWLSLESEPLGGVGKTVEVDKSNFKRAKDSKRGCARDQWVLGGIERESRRMFLVPVEYRTSPTIITIIKEQIVPGSTVITSSWEGYNNLGNEGYLHLTVNQPAGLEDVETGVHTNTMKSVWKHIKNFLPESSSVEKDELIYYLGHYKFSDYCKKQNIDSFDKILDEISKITFYKNVFEDENLDDEIEESQI